MEMVIVPSSLSADITAALDRAYSRCPDAEVDREEHHRQLISFFHHNGYIPEFDLRKADKE